MKTTLTALLCLALAIMPVQAETVTNAPPKFPWLCALVLGALAAGGYIIFTVATANQCAGKHKLVLESDHYDANWIPIATNIVQVSTNKIEVFRQLMTDEMCRYRVQDCGVVP